MSKLRITFVGDANRVPWRIGQRGNIAGTDYIVTHIGQSGTQWTIDMCQAEEYLLSMAMPPLTEVKFPDGIRMLSEPGDTVADFLARVRKVLLSRLS